MCVGVSEYEDARLRSVVLAFVHLAGCAPVGVCVGGGHQVAVGHVQCEHTVPAVQLGGVGNAGVRVLVL